MLGACLLVATALVPFSSASAMITVSAVSFNNPARLTITDPAGNSVSATTARQVYYLWQLGKTASHSDAIAIQWGIWDKLAGPNYSFALVGADPYITSQAAMYAASTKMVSSVPYTWTSDDGHQSWLAVPEPASWAMMIAGFSMMGVVMRIRARRATYSYAS